MERLAFWLLDEAPNAPRYVFDDHDVVTCCSDDRLLPAVLQPSRLISQWDLDKQSLHFLHTTFHEYLAACCLVREHEETVIQHIHTHAYDAAWQEVFRFAAGTGVQTSVGRAFWQEMRLIAAKPDRFGLLYIRLAYLVAETGVSDGGTHLLGLDLREKLWERICEGLAINIFVDALIEMDTSWYIQRVRNFNSYEHKRLRARLLRTLKRVKTPESSRILVEQILSGDKSAAAVASFAASKVLDTEGRNILRQALNDPAFPLFTRKMIIQTLGYARDYESVESLLNIARQDDTLTDETLSALGRIGGHTVSTALVTMLAQTVKFERKAQIVDALGQMREVNARDGLLEELALCSPDDPLVRPILEALCENPSDRSTGAGGAG